MKVGILTQYYPPEVGAPQARLSALAQRLVEQGHQVFVLTAMPNYPQGRIQSGYGGVYRREDLDGVTILRTYVYPTQSIGMGRRLSNYFSFVCSSLFFGAAVLPRLDYLLTESPPLFLGISGYLLGRLKGARWVFNVSDLWPESEVHLGVIRDGWILRMAKALEAFCYHKAWLVTGQSKEILQDILSRFPDISTYHLSNGADTIHFCPELRSATARQLMADGKCCIALYAGLHGLAQGLEQVLEAAAELQDQDDCCFVLIGDGPEKGRLVERGKALGLSNVCFLPPYPHGEMPALLASADIALITLKDRLPGAVPSKIYEAMAVGLPVILAADGEAAAIVRGAEAGIVVPPGEVAPLTSAVRELAANPDLRRRLGAGGRKAAVAHFDRPAICDAFIRH